MFFYIVYSSITNANRIKKYFEGDRDYISLLHTPSAISKGGCSYCLKVKESKVNDIINTSKEFGIKVRGIFKETEPNIFVEV